MARRKTHEEFVKEIYIKNPNIEILSQYVNSRTKITCKCRICNHKWDVLPTSPSRGTGCPSCGIERVRQALSSNTQDFIEKLSLINNDVIITSEYISAKDKVDCECKVCGSNFKMKPNSLLNGQSCPICAKEKRRTACVKTKEQFVNEMKYVNDTITILGEYVNTHTKLLCKCQKCNHEWNTTPHDLLDGYGCPKCNISLGENEIEEMLVRNNINYEIHKKYDGLYGVGNGKLSYDFYLPNYNLLIEFQGKQHETPIDYFGGEETFIIQQEHDRRKREYAKEHNIELLEIWYWDFNNIEQILSEKLNINNITKSA